ncbi:unnamed protein product [Albugo candida]|uniref:Uncharacterized protein n=1 Tax=Albugo candida TaxID=65357 RepID=A0A024GT56_9STRA|nr:unnamed protein product [Albugo candida]|eukprot:CCI50132.1 unnamed protein product [Albugo candida]
MGGDWYLERQKITAKEADTIDYTFDSRELSMFALYKIVVDIRIQRLCRMLLKVKGSKKIECVNREIRLSNFEEPPHNFNCEAFFRKLWKTRICTKYLARVGHAGIFHRKCLTQ